jgi:hypothetical protein
MRIIIISRNRNKNIREKGWNNKKVISIRYRLVDRNRRKIMNIFGMGIKARRRAKWMS